MKNWFVLYAVAVVIGATYMDWKAGFCRAAHAVVRQQLGRVVVLLGRLIGRQRLWRWF